MQRLIDLLKAPDARPVFLTGAGISLASGIPTFRGPDPDAVWAKDVTEKATNEYFNNHPDLSWAWYLDRFAKTLTADPNPAHEALVAIERLVPGTAVVTQNVDSLHHKAGQKNLVEVHGTSRKFRCSFRHCANGPPDGVLPWDEAFLTAFRADPKPETVPECPKCRSALRPHVLWFDEEYTSHMDYNIGQACDWFDSMSVLVCVGTSFSVNITMMALASAGMSGPVVVIDPHVKKPLDDSHILYREPAEVFLPLVAASL